GGAPGPVVPAKSPGGDGRRAPECKARLHRGLRSHGAARAAVCDHRHHALLAAITMLTKLIAFLNGEDVGATPKHDALQLAVAALLVEAAWRDDVFEPSEREAIERVLAERFEITHEEAVSLIKVASENRSNQLFGFTNKIVKAMDEADRIKIIEM